MLKKTIKIKILQRKVMRVTRFSEKELFIKQDLRKGPKETY